MGDSENYDFLDVNEHMLLSCSKAELKEKLSKFGKISKFAAASGADMDARHGRGRHRGDPTGARLAATQKFNDQLLHVKSDELVITDKRFLMISEKKRFRIDSYKLKDVRSSWPHNYEIYLDKAYAITDVQKRRTKNEEAVKQAQEAYKNSGLLKKIGAGYGFGKKEFSTETYGSRIIPLILVGVEKKKHMFGGEELELKFYPMPLPKTEQTQFPESASKLAEVLKKLQGPPLTKGVYGLTIKEKDKVDELFQILKQKADENMDIIPHTETELE